MDENMDKYDAELVDSSYEPGGAQTSTSDEAMVNSPACATKEELIGKLKATVEQQGKSLKENEDFMKKYKKLKKKYARAKDMFRNEWNYKKQIWKRMEAELELLTGEEKQVMETLHGLKDTLVQVSSEGGRKLEEIRRLTRKVEELKNGKHNKNGLGTLEDGANAEKDSGILEWREAASIFPEEIWEMIFGNISDPKGLWNLCNTCQLFGGILSKWKTGWMLGQALPYIYKDLSGGKLLECRLVCKSWDAALNEFLVNHPSVRPHNPDNIDPRRLDFVDPMKEMEFRENSRSITFCSEEDSSILEEPDIVKIPGRSSFLGRFLCMDILEFQPAAGNEDEDFKKLMEIACNFLTIFGSEIYYLGVWLGRPEDQELHPRIVQFLSLELFQYLPNLRELQMDCIEDWAHPSWSWSPNSLPTLAGLETLQIYNPSFFDPLSEVRITKYHSQIGKLCLTASSSPFVCFSRLEWPNLRELHLNLIRDLGSLCRLWDVRMPQLSKLALSLNELNDGATSTFKNLLELIRYLSPDTRLNTVRLEGGLQLLKLERDIDLGDAYHAAPAIKTLELDHNWGEVAPNYTFLLRHFPLIENIHLFRKRDDEYYETEVDLLPQEECLKKAVANGVQKVFEIVEVNTYAYRVEYLEVVPSTGSLHLPVGRVYQGLLWGISGEAKYKSEIITL